MFLMPGMVIALYTCGKLDQVCVMRAATSSLLAAAALPGDLTVAPAAGRIVLFPHARTLG